MAWYYISLGSNINPKHNVRRMLDGILQISERIDLSRILETKAEGFKSNNTFFNLVARIYSPLSPIELKACFNAIETQMGRDRNDPDKKKKDRAADIDILFTKVKAKESVALEEIPTESYIQPFVLELLQFLQIPCIEKASFDQEGVSFLYHNTLIGKTPLTLYRQEDSLQQFSMPLKMAG